MPVKSIVWYSVINSVVIKNNLTVPANARRHSIAVIGGYIMSLRFTSFGVQTRAASGQQDGPYVLKYEDIGDALYEGFTIVVSAGGTDCAVIETYTEERPVD